MSDLTNILSVQSIASAQRTTSAQVVAGAAIDVTGVERIKHFLRATAVAAGTVGIQDVQFADDSSFSENVDTYTSDDYLIKNDTSNTDSAIAQTVLSAAGAVSIEMKNLAKEGQKYSRVRTVASSGSPDATFQVQTILSYLDAPKVQS